MVANGQVRGSQCHEVAAGENSANSLDADDGLMERLGEDLDPAAAAIVLRRAQP